MRKLKRRRRWAIGVGGYGYRVTACERGGSGVLYLRWWDKSKNNWAWRSLGHRDRELAERQAKDLAGVLLATNEAECRGDLTVGDLFARFEDAVIRHAESRQANEDRRRLAIWAAFLGAGRQLASLDRPLLDRFVRLRRTGQLVVPGVALKAAPTERTIGADLEWLRRCCNWALTAQRANGKPLLNHHPLTRYPIPSNPNPRRPVATYDRYLAVRATANQIDKQHLFGAFLDLVEGLGWRVSAICSLRASDVDLRASEARPFGRVRRRAEFDKMGVEQWVPLAPAVRAAILSALDSNPVIGEAPLFPAPKRAGKAWTRHHAKDLLERAEKAAGLEPLDGSDFHAYRRAWATARKHLPLKDVAEAGGWRSTDTLLRCYTQADEATMLAVITEPRKVRSMGVNP